MFAPRPDDIYIASYPRSGTSLVQMVLYQLLTDGEMAFRHISDVMPFLERSLRAGGDLDGLPSPRVLKTHLPYSQVSQWPGRRIYVYREGRDVLISYFYMYKNYVNPAIDFAEFFRDFLSGRVQYGSWFQHVASWTANSRADVLLIRYEDLIRATWDEAEKIASFIKVAIPIKKRGMILERCSFRFMREHEEKFAPESGGERALPKGSFIRQGRSGGWKEILTETQKLAFERFSREYGIIIANREFYLPAN